MINLNNRILCESCLSEVLQFDQVCPLCGFKKESYNVEIGVLEMGEILAGKYLIGKTLGRGGFGVTYLGYDINNKRRIAIKEYLPDGLATRQIGQNTLTIYSGEKETIFKTGAQRFFDEAKMVSHFNGNPNIISVYEFFHENNTSYYVMEYIEGMDFKKYIANNGGKITIDKAVEIMIPIIDALAIVHSGGILHRDISPDNIYISNNGNVKLLDFGAARQVLGEQSKGLSIVLKQGFTPFEQYQSKGNFGPWSDIYALGATFYYAITGVVPEYVMDRVEKDQLKFPSQLGVKINSELERVIMRSLSLKAENRQQSMNEFKSDFLKAIMPQQFDTRGSKPTHSQVQTNTNENSILTPLHQQHNYYTNNDINNSLHCIKINNSNKIQKQLDENLFLKRGIAYLFDLLFYLMFIGMEYILISWIVFQLGMIDVITIKLLIILVLLSKLLYTLLNANLEASKKQATFGKMILKLKVVDIKGNQLTSRQSLIRNLYKILGFILLLTEKQGQYLHEKKSSSRVISNSRRANI